MVCNEILDDLQEEFLNETIDGWVKINIPFIVFNEEVLKTLESKNKAFSKEFRKSSLFWIVSFENEAKRQI